MGAGDSTLDGQIGALTPEEQDRVNSSAQILGGGGSQHVDYVPWLGPDYARSKDIKKVPASPNAGDERIRMLQHAAPDIYGQAEKLDPISGFNESDYGNPEAVPHPIEQKEPAILQDATQVLLDPYNWSPEFKAQVAQQMINAGMLDEHNWDQADLLKAWGTLVGEAIDHHIARPNDLLTPLDMLDLNHGNGDATKPKKLDPVSVIRKTTSISTNDQARGMLRQMMGEKLGRRPTETEVDDFQASLNQAQRTNPTVTTSVSNLNPDGSERDTNSTTTGGLDSSEFADHYTDNRDPDSEYGRYQAATTYFSAMMGAIRGPGGAVSNG